MKLTGDQIDFLKAFSKSCRRSILEMVTNAQSGHPGGSLSCVDYLSLIYTQRVATSNETVIVSNGHISPAVYSVLSELKVIPKEHVIKTFRTPEDIYEGHVNRRIPGVWFGTGPLGVGGSAATGFALAEALKRTDAFVFLIMGDGEQQEGQVYEMLNFAAHYKLGNLINFIDVNEVQLSDAIGKIMPVNIRGYYEAAGWQIIEADGHDFEAMGSALDEAMSDRTRPSVILAKTVMGKGVDFMEETGLALKADWHGKAPKAEQTAEVLEKMLLSHDEARILEEGLSKIIVNIKTPYNADMLEINTGDPITYGKEVLTDCRGAYGAALTDLARLNPQILALTADLSDSVKTDGVKKNFPERHIECGIAEQHMVSLSGGLSLAGFVPFCSTFGAFMTSRAKDQARVNDINEANVKMVATHCGLSVGEDGPTHQAIDDIASFSGFFHTRIFEPADPNQCDRIIRAVAKLPGNVYVRMGRAKIPVLTAEDGTPFFGESYEWEPGKIDCLRKGERATVVASGPMVIRALEVIQGMGGDIDLLVVSSFLPFDEATLIESAKKTGKVLTIQDHHLDTGLAAFVERTLIKNELSVKFEKLGVDHYQLSGTSDELYKLAGLSIEAITDRLQKLLNS